VFSDECQGTEIMGDRRGADIGGMLGLSCDGRVNHAGVGCVKRRLQERERGVADGQGNGH